jgi:hypothetical protein
VAISTCYHSFSSPRRASAPSRKDEHVILFDIASIIICLVISDDTVKKRQPNLRLLPSISRLYTPRNNKPSSFFSHCPCLPPAPPSPPPRPNSTVHRHIPSSATALASRLRHRARHPGRTALSIATYPITSRIAAIKAAGTAAESGLDMLRPFYNDFVDRPQSFREASDSIESGSRGLAEYGMRSAMRFAPLGSLVEKSGLVDRRIGTAADWMSERAVRHLTPRLRRDDW